MLDWFLLGFREDGKGGGLFFRFRRGSRLRLGAREQASGPRRRWWLFDCFLGFRENGEGGLFFRGGLFPFPEQERGKLREERRLDGLLGLGCGLGARLQRLGGGRFLVGLFPWRLRRGIRLGINATFFLLFHAAEAAADEAVAEDAPGGGGVSFVLLLPTADACAEASKKDDEHDHDDKCW